MNTFYASLSVLFSILFFVIVILNPIILTEPSSFVLTCLVFVIGGPLCTSLLNKITR